MKSKWCLVIFVLCGSVTNVEGQATNELQTKDGTGKQNRVVVSHFSSSDCSPTEKKSSTVTEVDPGYAELANGPKNKSLPSSFTICSMAMAPQSKTKKGIQFFALLDGDGENVISAFLHGPSSFWTSFRLNVRGNPYIPPGTVSSTVFPEQWVRSCLSVEMETGRLQWVVDGQEVENRIFEEITESSDKEAQLGRILLGRSKWPTNNEWIHYNNKVANLNIFSLALSLEEMLTMTSQSSEECGKNGDFFAWDSMVWILKGSALLEEWQKDDICSEPMIHIFNTRFPSWDSCVQHCEKINSRIPSVVTLKEWERLQSFFQKNVYDKGLDIEELWLSITDEKEEGQWADYYTNKKMLHQGNFEQGQPNGGRAQNHIMLRNGQLPGELSDTRRDYPQCGCICDRNSSSVIRLRGLSCYISSIDSLYKPVSTKDDVRNFIYMGNKSTDIRFVNGAWRISVVGSNITGFSEASKASYALGKHKWTIQGGNLCDQDPLSMVELKLTGCPEGSFTCDNGQCVTMDKRCNQLAECPDKSDEKSCNLLVLEKSYNKNIPPISSSKEGKVLKVQVSVSIDLLSIVSIKTDVNSIQFQFKITLEWMENRATYHNLKNTESLNILTQDGVDQLWLPELIYKNTDQQESTRLGMIWEWRTSVFVNKRGKFTRDHLSIDETEVFSGTENNLIMKQAYTHEFQCVYNLNFYPFDTQTCKIDMGLREIHNETIQLIPKKLKMTQGRDMSCFSIIDWKLERSQENGVQMVIVFRRKITSEMMTTYFPSLLLIAITFATTFFKPFFFEAALSVNLTTMLVMTTIFISKMESLPPTSEIRMIDCWLVLCQLLPFIEVVLLTAMEYFRDTETISKDQMYGNKEKMSRNERYVIGLMFVEKAVLPLFFLVTFVIYVGLAIMFYYNMS